METLTGSGSDRLLGLFSARDPASAGGLELNEDDIFGSQSPNSPAARNPDLSRRVISGRNLGILAALPDRNHNPSLTPKLSISCSSSAITIPPPAKKEKGKVYYSSAPVSIPAVNLRSKGFDLNGGGWDADDDEMMTMPPHEIVARRESRESSPMATTFSVLEGKGRTLKGRDLRRVRNAVFRTTGFED